MGVQQCQDERGRRVEGCIPNKLRAFRTAGYVFGLCNSPAMFQTMMDNIFDDLITEGVVVMTWPTS